MSYNAYITKINKDKAVYEGQTVSSPLRAVSNLTNVGFASGLRINTSNSTSTKTTYIGVPGPSGEPGRSIEIVWVDSIPNNNYGNDSTIAVVQGVGDVYSKETGSWSYVDNIKGPSGIVSMEQIEQAVLRYTSPGVPISLFDGNYSARSDDQRIVYIGSGNNNLTLLPADQAKNRRFLLGNAGKSPYNILGELVSMSGLVDSERLYKGETLEVVSEFFINSAGLDQANSDIYYNGNPLPSGTKGDYRYQIVTHNKDFVYKNQFNDAVSQLYNEISNISLISGPVGPSGAQGIVGPSGFAGRSPTNEELTSLIHPLIPSPISGPSGLKGDKGDRGDVGPSGWSPNNSYLSGLINPLIPSPIVGPNGATGPSGWSPSNSYLNGLITPLIPAPIPGPSGIKGSTGPSGLQGLSGPSGLTGPIGPSGLSGTTPSSGYLTSLISNLIPSGSFKEIRTKRIPIPGILSLGLIGVDVVWNTPMPSVNYTISPAIEGALGVANINNITSHTVSGCIISVKNVTLGALIGNTSTLHVTAIHD